MRQAADILSSAPAMQIRYLEAMQAMAKSANSKVIFLPGANQGSASFNAAIANAKPYEGDTTIDTSFANFGGDTGFQQAINARVVENI
jgi:hypothetical protein